MSHTNAGCEACDDLRRTLAEAAQREARLVAAGAAVVQAFDKYDSEAPDAGPAADEAWRALDTVVCALDELTMCPACRGYGDDGDAPCQACGGTKARSVEAPTPTPTTREEADRG